MKEMNWMEQNRNKEIFAVNEYENILSSGEFVIAVLKYWFFNNPRKLRKESEISETIQEFTLVLDAVFFKTWWLIVFYRS